MAEILKLANKLPPNVREILIKEVKLLLMNFFNKLIEMEHTDSIRLNLDIPNSSVPAISAEVTNMKQTKKKRRSILKVQPVSEREALKVSQIQNRTYS